MERKVLLMFKKSLKKFVSIVLSTVMVMGMSTTAFAEENFPVSVNAPAKAAIVTNVAKDGSNLTDDRHINSNTEIYNVSMNITALLRLSGIKKYWSRVFQWQNQLIIMLFSIKQLVITIPLKLSIWSMLIMLKLICFLRITK